MKILNRLLSKLPRFRSILGLHAFWMTVRESWKGFLVYTLIMLIMFAGVVQLFPSFAEAFMEDVAEAQGIKLQWEDEDEMVANLSWEPVEGAAAYTVLQDNQSFALGRFVGLNHTQLIDLLVNMEIYNGTDTSLLIQLEDNSTIWYVVFIAMKDGNFTSTGIVSTDALFTENPFDEFLSNSAYQGFSGGRDLDFLDIRGFMSVYVGSYLSIMIGFYAAYLGVTVVSRDVERKSMDLILSTPISRRRLLIERMAAVGAMILVLLLILLWAVIGAVEIIGEEVDKMDIAATFLVAFPLMLVIVAWSALLSVWLNDVKMAMGGSFAIAFVLYMISFASSITESLEPMANFTPFGYYRFADLLYGEWTTYGDVAVLVGLTVVLVAIAIWQFRRKELPT